jgi:hypothetical protein
LTDHFNFYISFSKPITKNSDVDLSNVIFFTFEQFKYKEDYTIENLLLENSRLIITGNFKPLK